jgi:hypothetical protein
MIDMFDFVVGAQKQVSAPLGWNKLHCNIGFDISWLLEQVNGKCIEMVINLDTVSEVKGIEDSITDTKNLFLKLPVCVGSNWDFRIVNILAK